MNVPELYEEAYDMAVEEIEDLEGCSWESAIQMLDSYLEYDPDYLKRFYEEITS